MQVTQTSAQGLSREFHVRIPQAHLASRLNEKLEEVRGQVHLKGFRPGKAPVSFLRKMYGKGMMSELIQEEMAAAQQKAFEDGKVMPAMAPQAQIENGLIDRVIAGAADLEYRFQVEVLPQFEPVDVATLQLERPVAAIADEEVAAELEKLAAENKQFDDRADGEGAVTGDRVEIDFVGKIDGEAFQGGSAEDVPLELGSGAFIPGFEDGLMGVTKGESKTLEITFPADYGAKHLAGKAATFDVTVKAVKAARPPQVDDALATSMGLESLDALRARVRQQLERRDGAQSRLHLKRRILDALDTTHSFELPAAMVSAEFQQIWQQVMAAERDEEDKNKSEEELRTEYHRIAERRVRLGLVLAEIGKRADVTVPEQDMNRALQMQAMQAGVPVQRVIDFYRENPNAWAQLRAPLYEDRVIDYITDRATVTNKTVSREELMQEPGEI